MLDRWVIVDGTSSLVKNTLYRDDRKKPELTIFSYQGKNEIEKPLLVH